MARKKVKLAWIANDSSRRATLKKRRKGLMKKVSELSTLCAVRACAVVFSPDDPEPEVWPAPVAVRELLSDFRRLPQLDQTKKMMDQEGFLRHQVGKIEEQFLRLQRENQDLELKLLMYKGLTPGKDGVDGMDPREVRMLLEVIEAKMKAVQDRLETVRGPMTGALPVPPHDTRMGLTTGAMMLQESNLINHSNINMNNNHNWEGWYADVMISNLNGPAPTAAVVPAATTAGAYGGSGEMMQMQMQMPMPMQPYMDPPVPNIEQYFWN